jgi:hypothetical protein
LNSPRLLSGADRLLHLLTQLGELRRRFAGLWFEMLGHGGASFSLLRAARAAQERDLPRRQFSLSFYAGDRRWIEDNHGKPAAKESKSARRSPRPPESVRSAASQPVAAVSISLEFGAASIGLESSVELMSG